MGKKLGMACKLYYSDALLDGTTVTADNATWNGAGQRLRLHPEPRPR